MTKDKWENTVWDTDVYLDDIDKLDEKKHKCGSAKSCEYGDMCKTNYDIGGCSHYKEKRPQTNEEYIKSLDTKQLAKWLSQCSQILYDCGQRDVFPKTMYEEDWEWWLKQPHTVKE